MYIYNAIQLYRNFEESSLINIVGNYIQRLAGIGSRGVLLETNPKFFGSENVRSECQWFDTIIMVSLFILIKIILIIDRSNTTMIKLL